jgi:hypothetical protein
MQPSFLPWMGYFALMMQADDFVFLDDVQFSKRSWQRRNQVLGPNGLVAISLAVAGKPSRALIKDTKLADGIDLNEIMDRAEGCLGTAPHWAEVAGVMETGLSHSGAGLAAVNIAIIRAIAGLLGIETRFHRSSSLGVSPADKSDRLRAICKALGADCYLSPVGSAGYLSEANPFSEDTIRLRFLNFRHPEYTQRWGAFQSHMSAIDALAYLGPTALGIAIRSGIGPTKTLKDISESDQ